MHLELRHRHALVAPLFALMVGTSLVPTLFVSAEQPSSASQAWKTFPSGAAILALDASDVDTSDVVPVLRDGAVLMAGGGTSDLSAGPVSVRTFDGAAYVRFQNNRVTVVALTSPVDVRIDTEHTIVPVGRQWSFAGDRLPGITDGWQTWWAARESVPVPRNFLLRHVALLDGLPARGEPPQDPLLALFHPSHREQAWQQGGTSALSDADTALLLLGFPSADLLPQPVAPAVVERYQSLLLNRFLQLPAPATFLQTMHEELRRTTAELRDQGFVLREHAFDAISTALTERYGAATSASSSSALSSNAPSSSASSASSASSVSCGAPLSVDEAVTQVRALLSSLQAAFTVQTHIEPNVADGTVHVDSIVVAAPDGDRLLSFDVDPACGRVLRIEYHDTVLPYGLSVQAFQKWLRE